MILRDLKLLPTIYLFQLLIFDDFGDNRQISSIFFKFKIPALLSSQKLVKTYSVVVTFLIATITFVLLTVGLQKIT